MRGSDYRDSLSGPQPRAGGGWQELRCRGAPRDACARARARECERARGARSVWCMVCPRACDRLVVLKEDCRADCACAAQRAVGTSAQPWATRALPAVASAMRMLTECITSVTHATSRRPRARDARTMTTCCHCASDMLLSQLNE
jgi:hypothetical protein